MSPDHQVMSNKSSGSFLGKFGLFGKGKKDGEKRAKKRKHKGDVDLNADVNLPSADVDVDASGKAPSVSGESDFIVVDTPKMPKKEGEKMLHVLIGYMV